MKDFLNLTVVIFDSIELSAASIVFSNFEYLKTLSNLCSVSVLKSVTAFVTRVLISSEVFVVCFSSKFIVDVNNTLVVSGSTITGVTDATENLLSCVTISSLVVSVRVEPEAALIAI